MTLKMWPFLITFRIRSSGFWVLVVLVLVEFVVTIVCSISRLWGHFLDRFFSKTYYYFFEHFFKCFSTFLFFKNGQKFVLVVTFDPDRILRCGLNFWIVRSQIYNFQNTLIAPALPDLPFALSLRGGRKETAPPDFELRGDRGRPGPPDTEPKIEKCKTQF